MTDYTKLIEEACDCSRQIGITEAGRAHGNFTQDDSRFLTAMQQSKAKHVAALQSAIEALQATATVREGQADHWQRVARASQAECNALQAKLDELQRQEPIYQFSTYSVNQWVDMTKEDYEKVKGSKYVRIVYAAPKAQAPLTRDAVKVICSEAGYTHASAQEKADFINGLRHGEKAHGITKGTPMTKEQEPDYLKMAIDSMVDDEVEGPRVILGLVALKNFFTLVRNQTLEEAAQKCRDATASIWDYHEDERKEIGTTVCNNLAASIESLKEPTP